MKKFKLKAFKQCWSYWLIILFIIFIAFIGLFGLEILASKGIINPDDVVGVIYGREITYYDVSFMIGWFLALQFYFSAFTLVFKWCLRHIVEK